MSAIFLFNCGGTALKMLVNYLTFWERLILFLRQTMKINKAHAPNTAYLE